MDDLEWAKKLVDEGAFVFHMPTKSIGRVAKLFDGRGEQYVSTLTQQPTQGPVIEMANGASFVAKPGEFMRLEEREAEFYVRAVDLVGGLSLELGRLAVAHRVRPTTCAVLLAAALRAQVAELERALPKSQEAP